jgi:hypothetical protein
MGISDFALELEAQNLLEASISDSLHEYEEAIFYLESFGKIINDEDEYADYVTAMKKIEEYQDIATLHIPNENLNDNVAHQLEMLKSTIIELSHKLKEREESISLNEKKQITVKDFEKLYSISKESQRKLRKRLSDPLPHTQIENCGNVLYNPKEVDKWFENYKKERS